MNLHHCFRSQHHYCTCTILTIMLICFSYTIGVSTAAASTSATGTTTQATSSAVQASSTGLYKFPWSISTTNSSFWTDIFYFLCAVRLLLHLSLQQRPRHLSYHQKLLAKALRRYCTYLFKLQLAEFHFGNYFFLLAMLWRLENVLPEYFISVINQFDTISLLRYTSHNCLRCRLLGTGTMSFKTVLRNSGNMPP